MVKTIFNSVQVRKPSRNTFSMPFFKDLSGEMGDLIPIMNEHVLPGDKFKIQVSHLVRFAPLIAPIMHQVDVYFHFWYVPYRQVWSNWEEFISDTQTETPPVFPTCLAEGSTGEIPDYLGIPTKEDFDTLYTPSKVSAIDFAAYGLIWNENYRDQNLQAELDIDLADGDNTTLLEEAGLFGTPLKRAWEQDYFTTALPEPQKGPTVVLPIQGEAEIIWRETPDSSDGDVIRDPETGSTYPTNDDLWNMAGNLHGSPDGANMSLSVDNSRHLFAELSTATQSSINDLRKAYRLQAFLELMARAGNRYPEVLRAHFNVTPDDLRIQRPLYLGGGISNVAISEIAQTSEGNQTPQGNLSGQGISLGSSRGINHFFKEHGVIIGLMSIRPKPLYLQGLRRQWFKFDKYDFAWPMFAHLGEQEVFNYELYADGQSEQFETFGYAPRYAEYKYIPSTVHGDMKNTLDFYHFGRRFGARPALNSKFIECVPTKNPFAVQDIPDDGSGEPTPVRNWHSLYIHLYFKVKATRPLPYYGTPLF